MRAQVAFEYMLMVIVAMAFLVPIWTYMSTVQTETSNELAISYARHAVERIASTADLIYSQGAPAKSKVSVYIPGGVEEVNITNYTISVRLRYGSELTDVFASSKARMNGAVPIAEGNYWVEIRAVENEVYDVNITSA